MDRRLGGASMVKAKDEAISDTGATHDMDPNYGSFMSYCQYSSGEYVTFGKGLKEPIKGSGTTLVRLGGIYGNYPFYITTK